MGQEMDGEAQRVLSTGQLTLMKLWLLQAKYFPLHILSKAFLPSSPPPLETVPPQKLRRLFSLRILRT